MASSSDLVVVLDGATVRTATGCTHGPAWYARKLGAAILGHAAARSASLRHVVSEAIRDVASQHSETCNLDDPAAPSAAVGIVRNEGAVTRYLVLGDVTVVCDVAGRVQAISDDRVSRTAVKERAAADQHSIGSPEKEIAMRRMKEVELAAKNRPGGYWIAGSNPTAVEHAITGEWNTADIARFAVMSDGAARFVNMFSIGSWDSALDILNHNGPERFLEHVRLAEAADHLGTRAPRNKKSDDATVVYAVPHPTLRTEPRSPSVEQRTRSLAAMFRPTGLMCAEPVDPAWLARPRAAHGD